MKMFRLSAFLLLMMAIVSSCQTDLLEDIPATSSFTTHNQYEKVQVEVEGAAGFNTGDGGRSGSTRAFSLKAGSAPSYNALIDYKEGEKINIYVYCGISVTGQDKEESRAYFIIPIQSATHKVGDGCTFNLTYSGVAYSFDVTPEFIAKYRNPKNKVRNFVASVAGGQQVINQNEVTMYFNPNQQKTYSFAEEGFRLNRSGVYEKVTLKHDDEPIFTAGLEDKKMEIPLYTKEWIEAKDTVAIYNQKTRRWSFKIPSISYDILGNIIGFTYRNTMDYPRILNAFEVQCTDRKDKIQQDEYLWYNSDLKVSFDFLNDGTMNIDRLHRSRQSFRLTNVILPPSSVNNGVSKPVYVWSYGPGGYMKFHTDVLDGTPDDFSSLQVKGVSVPIYNKMNRQTEEYLRPCFLKRDGVSYTVSMNGVKSTGTKNIEYPSLETNMDLIITELYHHNPGIRRNGFSPDNMSIVEIYNPTNHDINLADYGFIRIMGPRLVKASNGLSYDNLNDALVQTLYDKRLPGIHENYGNDPVVSKFHLEHFDDDVRNFAGRSLSRDKFYNRVRVMAGDYNGVLKPHMTALYMAGHCIDYHDSWRCERSFKSLPQDIVEGIEKALGKTCQFIVSVDNGWNLNSFANAGGPGKKSGVLQHWSRSAITLVKRVHPGVTGSPYKMLDACGPSFYAMDHSPGISSSAEVRSSEAWHRFFDNHLSLQSSDGDMIFSLIRGKTSNVPCLDYYSQINLRDVDMTFRSTDYTPLSIFDPHFAAWGLYRDSPMPEGQDRSFNRIERGFQKSYGPGTVEKPSLGVR